MKTKIRLVFIAGPFGGESHWDVQCNVHAARVAGLEVARMGGMPIIPHANSCYFFGTLPETHWLAGYLELLARCDALLVLPGWEDSKGTMGEIELATELCMPTFYSQSALWAWLRAQRAGRTR